MIVIGVKARAKGSAIGSVAVSDQVAWCAIPWEGLADLLRCPFRGRMRGHAEMQNAPSLVMQHNENEQEAERDGWHNEKVNDYETACVITKECTPGLRGRLRMPDHAFGHSSLADSDPEFEQLTMDPRCAPQGVLSSHASDQALTSAEIVGRPLLRGRDFHAQKFRKPLRCHRTTVSGLTTTSAPRQPDQRRYSTTQNSLSVHLRRTWVRSLR